MEVLISNLQEKFSAVETLEVIIEKVVKKTLEEKEIKQAGEVSIALVDNAYIQKLNQEYRQKDYPTDVLSFPMDGIEPNEEYLLLGDIVISLEKAEEQAKEYGHSLEREIAFLTVHGMLHLLGYDHEEEEERGLMEKEQEVVLTALGINR